MINVAIAGQIDDIALQFCQKLSLRTDVVITGISRRAHAAAFVKNWRLGTMISSNDSRNCLENIDLAFYFCLNPSSNHQRAQGNPQDVMLMRAIHFIREALRYPQLRVVLVSRLFDEPLPENCPNYKAFSEINFLFQDSALNLNLLQVTPLLSAMDSITYHALLEANSLGRDFSQSKYLTLTQPCSLHTFNNALLSLVDKAEKSIKLAGNTIISHADYLSKLREVQQRSPLKMMGFDFTQNLVTNIKNRLVKDENRRLFEESLRFHSTVDRLEDQSQRADFEKTLKLIAEDKLLSTQEKKEKYPSIPNPSLEEGFSHCVVQRLLYNPNRSVEAIADLLMAWLPRRLDKILHIKRVENAALECQILRIPLFKLEKLVDDEQQSRILVSSNFFDDPEKLPHFLLYSTALDDPIYGVLLILLENCPDSRLALSFERLILNDFAKYLLEFKIGDSI